MVQPLGAIGNLDCARRLQRRLLGESK